MPISIVTLVTSYHLLILQLPCFFYHPYQLFPKRCCKINCVQGFFFQIAFMDCQCSHQELLEKFLGTGIIIVHYWLTNCKLFKLMCESISCRFYILLHCKCETVTILVFSHGSVPAVLQLSFQQLVVRPITSCSCSTSHYILQLQ